MNGSEQPPAPTQAAAPTPSRQPRDVPFEQLAPIFQNRINRMTPEQQARVQTINFGTHPLARLVGGPYAAPPPAPTYTPQQPVNNWDQYAERARLYRALTSK